MLSIRIASKDMFANNDLRLWCIFNASEERLIRITRLAGSIVNSIVWLITPTLLSWSSFVICSVSWLILISSSLDRGALETWIIEE